MERQARGLLRRTIRRGDVAEQVKLGSSSRSEATQCILSERLANVSGHASTSLSAPSSSVTRSCPLALHGRDAPQVPPCHIVGCSGGPRPRGHPPSPSILYTGIGIEGCRFVVRRCERVRLWERAPLTFSWDVSLIFIASSSIHHGAFIHLCRSR